MPRSLKKIALVVTLGTLLSKIGGLARQLVIASAFGVGAAYDAYNYAYVMPGFLLVLLGGINGPFHSAMVSVLSRRPKHEGAHVLAALSTMTSAALVVITFLMIIGADQIIKLIAPGLNSEVHQIAVIQLQIMAPIAFLAGLIGLGFGSLNARGEFLVPSISPLISSLSIVLSVTWLWLEVREGIGTPELALRGGVILAVATLVGALLQWLIQFPALIKKGLAKVKLIWDWKHPGVKEVLKVMGPATLSSGMLQINVFTDLFFASGILGAAAGLGYANLLVQTPLGLISNALIIPLLPTFSRLTSPSDQPALIARIRQGLMLSTAAMIPIGALFIALGGPIVSMVYERGAFDFEARKLVTALLMAYGLGMPAYLGRDLLVRIFYALGDGVTPFRLSLAGIVMNIFLDWLLLGGPTPWGNQMPLNFGAAGLVLATVAINLLTCFALLKKLSSHLGELPFREWAIDGSKLLFAGIFSGIAAWIMKSSIIWPQGLIGLSLEVLISTAISISVFVLISHYLQVKEVKELLFLIKQRFSPR